MQVREGRRKTEEHERGDGRRVNTEERCVWSATPAVVSSPCELMRAIACVVVVVRRLDPLGRG